MFWVRSVYFNVRTFSRSLAHSPRDTLYIYINLEHWQNNYWQGKDGSTSLWTCPSAHSKSLHAALGKNAGICRDNLATSPSSYGRVKRNSVQYQNLASVIRMSRYSSIIAIGNQNAGDEIERHQSVVLKFNMEYGWKIIWYRRHTWAILQMIRICQKINLKMFSF